MQLFRPDPYSSDKFSNDGETLRLVDIDAHDIASFTFNDIWYGPTDGDGYTLVPVDESNVAADRNDPASWGISCQLLGTPGAPNGIVLSQTFSGWLNYHFSAIERGDPMISGPLADRDGDGISTLLEFALALDPNHSDSSGLPSAEQVTVGADDYLAITFTRPRKPLNVSYTVELTRDLTTWTGGAVMVGTPIDQGDGTETVTFRDSDPISANSRRGMRLKVETTDP